jgi:hypothetical protein
LIRIGIVNSVLLFHPGLDRPNLEEVSNADEGNLPDQPGKLAQQLREPNRAALVRLDFLGTAQALPKKQATGPQC